jgi:hypothetical protein
MGSFDPFGYLKHNLWPKERPGIKLAMWLPIIKSWESTRLPYVQVACDIPLKSSQQGLQHCFRPHLDQRSAHKVMRPQSCGNPNFGNFWTKCHLDVGLMERHKVYYKGEGGGFPQVWVVVSLVSPSLPVTRPSTKSAQTMHWPTCCLVYVYLCESLMRVTLPSPHPGAPTRPSTPKVLRARERAPTLCSFTIFTSDSHLSSSKSLGVRQNHGHQDYLDLCRLPAQHQKSNLRMMGMWALEWLVALPISYK